MHYRTLGRTGINVSPYALGTLLLGASIGNTDHDDSIVVPGTDAAPMDAAQAVVPPAIENLSLRRRPLEQRAAA